MSYFVLVTQLDRVPRYERGRHGFKSYRLHSLICPNDGIGRHAALKKLCRKACEIVAHFGYHRSLWQLYDLYKLLKLQHIAGGR